MAKSIHFPKKKTSQKTATIVIVRSAISATISLFIFIVRGLCLSVVGKLAFVFQYARNKVLHSSLSLSIDSTVFFLG